MLRDFQAFINRGNVIELAVGVVLAGAFGLITTSLVNQVIMPPLGLLIGGVDFSELGFILRDAGAYASLSEAVEAGAPVIQLGAFINTVINFLIIAFAIFLVVRAYARAQERSAKTEVEKAAEFAAPPVDIALLTEIRDLLAKQQG
jgi:large conductance mechanosensitive channel